MSALYPMRFIMFQAIVSPGVVIGLDAFPPEGVSRTLRRRNPPTHWDQFFDTGLRADRGINEELIDTLLALQDSFSVVFICVSYIL